MGVMLTLSVIRNARMRSTASASVAESYQSPGLTRSSRRKTLSEILLLPLTTMSAMRNLPPSRDVVDQIDLARLPCGKSPPA